LKIEPIVLTNLIPDSKGSVNFDLDSSKYSSLMIFAVDKGSVT
jgi:hypothetical protein